MRYWIMKSDPRSYSIEDFALEKVTPWEGVRNYQARNFMQRDMRIGDLLLFYHSNKPPLGVVGLGEVVSSPYPDPTALDPSSRYYDERASEERPIWYHVDIRFIKHLRLVCLSTIKKHPDLQNMLLITHGRLSIQPITKKEFMILAFMGGSPEFSPAS